MPVPTYPSAITLADIQTEFGGSNPIGINEYYSGGTYVGSGTANSTGSVIPTSGAITFIDFSGASAVIVNYYRVRFVVPGSSTNYINNIDNSSPGQPLTTTVLGDKILWSWNFYPPVIHAQHSANGNTAWVKEWVLGGSDRGTYNNPEYITCANNGECIIASASMTRFYGGNGTHIWSANTKDTQWGFAAVSDGYIALRAYATSSNLYLAKFTTSGTTLAWYTGYVNTPGISPQFGKGLTVNRSESRVYCGFSWYSGSPSFVFTPSIHGWDTSGNKKWGYNIPSPYVGTIYLSDTSDNSNNFCIWFANFTLDFAKITDSDTSASVAWVRAVSSGNTVERVCIEPTGNVFVSCRSGLNSHITKVSSSGTAEWSRKLSHVTAPSGSARYVTSTNRIFATSRALYISVCMQYETIDTKGYWVEDGARREAHILCLPHDGTKTGTYINVKYESAGTMSLTSQTTPTLTSNTPSNTSISFTANTVANTMTLTQNNSLNLTATLL